MASELTLTAFPTAKILVGNISFILAAAPRIKTELSQLIIYYSV